MSAEAADPFSTPQQAMVLVTIADALHAECGPAGTTLADCGAEDMHTDNAVAVLQALESKGWLDFDAVTVP